jgi:hypothetical protein
VVLQHVGPAAAIECVVRVVPHLHHEPVLGHGQIGAGVCLSGKRLGVGRVEKLALDHPGEQMQVAGKSLAPPLRIQSPVDRVEEIDGDISTYP